MDYEVWMNKAISKINTIQVNSFFALKDLFDGIEWKSLSKGDRLAFGKFFKNEVKEGHVPNVIHAKKAQNNAALYRKENR